MISKVSDNILLNVRMFQILQTVQIYLLDISMQVSTISLVDVATLNSLPQGVYREKYALQRAFGVLGYAT